jgi:hypothetical protein
VFCSIDQAAVQRRQEAVVENIRRGWPRARSSLALKARNSQKAFRQKPKYNRWQWPNSRASGLLRIRGASRHGFDVGLMTAGARLANMRPDEI